MSRRIAVPDVVSIPSMLEQWTLTAIRALLVAGCFEDGRFDWKEMLPRDDSGKDRLVKAAVAMANTGGGFLVFGVRDRGAVKERPTGVAVDQEFARTISDLFHRADPPVPHSVRNPPVRVRRGFVIQVVQVLTTSAPHSFEGRFHVRTGGGSDRIMSTHEVRQLFRSQEVLEAPGLHEIKKVAVGFFRRRSWDDAKRGLEVLALHVVEGTPRHRAAVMDALTRLAVFTRASMPKDILNEMLTLAFEAMPHRFDNVDEIWKGTLASAIELAGDVGYDAALRLRDGFAVHESAQLLADCLQLAEGKQLPDLVARAVEAFRHCESSASRAEPEPFEDARLWFEYKRTNPSPRRDVPPKELDRVEARLLEVADLHRIRE